MAEAEADSSGQCQALTEGGERCSRPAQEDGFCYQHDEGDPTVSDSQSAQETEDEQNQQAQRTEPEIAPEETADPDDVDTDALEDEEVDLEAIDESKIEGILAVRRTVQSTAGELIGHRFDGVSEITPLEEGWRAVVEVVERASVPDTQDVLGRYEIELDEDGVVQGYRRIDRYRRGDTGSFED